MCAVKNNHYTYKSIGIFLPCFSIYKEELVQKFSKIKYGLQTKIYKIQICNTQSCLNNVDEILPSNKCTAQQYCRQHILPCTCITSHYIDISSLYSLILRTALLMKELK